MKVLIRGAGDVASGIALRLHNSGFKIIMCDINKPTFIRGKVCFGTSIYLSRIEIEGVYGEYCGNFKKDNSEEKKLSGAVEVLSNIEAAHKNNKIAVIVDEKLEILKELQVDAVVDAIIAKKNLGTVISMASIVIGVGPGFCAEMDCHAVVETLRGHNLGRVYYKGAVAKNTGIPGSIGGFSKERVLYSRNAGFIEHVKEIGDLVDAGEVIFKVHGEKLGISESIASRGNFETGNMTLKQQGCLEVEKYNENIYSVATTIDGVVRGLISEGLYVKENTKCADIDPRAVVDYCYSISDKARAIAGGVLEAIMHLYKKIP